MEEAGGWIQSREVSIDARVCVVLFVVLPLMTVIVKVLNVPRLYALGLEDDEIDEDVEELVSAHLDIPSAFFHRRDCYRSAG